jgi:hypothetical protein
MIGSQSSLLGAIDYFWVSGWLMLGLALFVWFARPPFHSGRAPVPEPAD